MATDLTGLTGELKVSLEAKPRKGLDLSVPQAILQMVKTLKLVFGAGAGEMDQIWWDRRVLAGNGGETLDLNGVAGVPLKNAFGQTVNFANVKAIILFNRSDETLTHAGGAHAATDASMTMGDKATGGNAFQGPLYGASDAIEIPAGGILVVTNPAADGWSVSAGDGDLLYIKNLDATDDLLFDIAFAGEST